MSEPATGRDHIREALLARQNIWATMARDCHVSLGLLESFAHGRTELSIDKLDLVVDFIWNGHILFNAEANALQPRQQPPARSIGICPTLNIDLPKFTPGPPPRGPQPVVAAPKPKPRPGWIGGWG
jgi:hypothetical protein